MGQKDITMLLSEFASTDLTKALLDDRSPCFPSAIWTQIEHGTVWWDQETYDGTTLASVFRIMADMSVYRQQIRGDPETLSMEVVQDFERCLQPSFQILNCDHIKNSNTYTVHESTLEPRMQADSFTRAFQHSALVYLYRAICGLPPRHSLGYGKAELLDHSTGRPSREMTTNALFVTCSTTKACTGATTSIAIQDSKATESPIYWDTPVASLIPEDHLSFIYLDILEHIDTPRARPLPSR
ncbi:hypothetical protein N7465_000976 [Penicillium sp. CMV-2018d]|nr:hypothetical protein N7465_000976 [Penicillium sp. CMV-2018d]